MSATANLVYRNFVWRIEAADPTATTIAKDRFFAIDPRAVHGTDPRTSSGLTRGFTVTWRGAGALNEIGGVGIADTDANRGADHTYVVEVYYSAKLKWVDAQALLLSDRHDIIEALRHQSSCVGYDASNTSTDLGMSNRWLEAEETEATEDYVVLRQTWRCSIFETG